MSVTAGKGSSRTAASGCRKASFRANSRRYTSWCRMKPTASQCVPEFAWPTRRMPPNLKCKSSGRMAIDTLRQSALSTSAPVAFLTLRTLDGQDRSLAQVPALLDTAQTSHCCLWAVEQLGSFRMSTKQSNPPGLMAACVRRNWYTWGFISRRTFSRALRTDRSASWRRRSELA